MIEIKKDKIIFDGLEKKIEDINVISLYKKYLSFSGRIADSVKYEEDLSSFYQQLKDAGLTGFVLVDNNIVNLNNIKSLHIGFYQYAGISIIKSSKANADTYYLNLVCKNGKNEAIPFRTFREVEHVYHQVDTALCELRNQEVVNNLLNQ